MIVVVKSSDEARTSNTTLTNDTELLFPIGVSETWVAYFTLYIVSSGAGQAQLTITVPTGATGNFYDTQWNYAVFNFASPDSITGISTGFGIVYLAVQVVNGANAGNVNLQWAQNSSNVSPTTMKQYSSMVALRQGE